MARLFRMLPSAGLLGFLLAAAWPSAVRGAEFRADERVHVKADEVIEGDLYAFGQHVTIEGTVKGDLIAFGSQVVVEGTVEGDLAAAAQTVLVEGTIGDDARVAGQVVKLASSSHVKGDVLAAGLSLELEQGAAIDGELRVAGYQADLSGDIQQDAWAATEHARIAGQIGGDAHLEIGGKQGDPPAQQFIAGQSLPVPMPAVPAGLTVTSTAKIGGKFQYSAPSEATIEEGASLASPAEFRQQKVAAAAPPTVQQQIFEKLRHFAVIGVLGLAMVLLLPGWSASLADTARQRPLGSLLGGIAGIVGFVVLLIVLIVAVIVLAIAFAAATLGELSAVVVVLGVLGAILLIGGFWLFTTYLAPVVASVALGRLLMAATGTSRVVLPFLLGFVIVALVCSIPYAGPWLAFAVMLLGLGALVLWVVWRRQEADAVPAKA